MLELKLKQSTQPLTDAWQHLPVAPRHSTLLGISFRPRQAEVFGLEARSTMETLLGYPFQVVRLGAYWNRIESKKDAFHTDELDWQIDAAERAGKQIILCVGPLKTFGYPEYFVPAHRLRRPFPEHTLIKPAAYKSLVRAATSFINHLVDRYRQHTSIIAWQLEHEAVDPLGVEHSWRLDVSFVQREMEVLRKADPGKPVLMNGFLPTSLPVRFSQWWRTRDQGDSLAVSRFLADMIGVDYYPRHALAAFGSRTLYLDGSQSQWARQKKKEMLDWVSAHGQRLLVAEGQAEPWEAVTQPPNPKGFGMYSCLPEHLISNYNAWMDSPDQPASLFAYLFWGAEYWMLRKRVGDTSYLKAFERILKES